VAQDRAEEGGTHIAPPPRHAASPAPGYRRGRPLRLRAGGLQRLAVVYL